MEMTVKETCNELAQLLHKYGVRNVVVSPGSRNVPLIMAFARNGKLTLHSVIDERSAAFVALGMSLYLREPVAVVCTSGSALLNYAPAVSEAYYRQVPLVVISADRPADRIDQDDSQTIRQPGILTNIVKHSVSVSDNWTDLKSHLYVNRLLNDALTKAEENPRGPVHINVEISEPLNKTEDVCVTDEARRIYHSVSTNDFDGFPVCDEKELSRLLSKPVIVAGFMQASENRDIFKTLSMYVPILAEGLSNLSGGQIITNVEEYLSSDSMSRPSLVITIGGALVSRALKERIREWGCPHWQVGYRNVYSDTFGTLTASFAMSPEHFAEKLLKMMQTQKLRSVKICNDEFVRSLPWSDLVACDVICRSVPENFAVHLSNGMAVRYCQSRVRAKSLECNRGVSGIDGCASTALGYSVMNEDPTLLITGDMCMQYDIAAFSSSLVSDKFKVVVLCNGDGGVFRIIKSTRNIPELDEYISPKVNLPLRQLSEAYGFEYFEAADLLTLERMLPEFMGKLRRPAVLAVKTDSAISAKTYIDYIHYCRKQKYEDIL